MWREFGGQNDRSPKAGGELFEPRCEVHRRADAGEIQPVTAADIAVEHFAKMERQTKAYAVCKADIGRRFDGVDVDLCFARRSERAITDLAYIRRSFGQGEDRQQSVANEFQYPPPCLKITGTWQSK